MTNAQHGKRWTTVQGLFSPGLSGAVTRVARSKSKSVEGRESSGSRVEEAGRGAWRGTRNETGSGRKRSGGGGVVRCVGN